MGCSHDRMAVGGVVRSLLYLKPCSWRTYIYMNTAVYLCYNSFTLLYHGTVQYTILYRRASCAVYSTAVVRQLAVQLYAWHHGPAVSVVAWGQLYMYMYRQDGGYCLYSRTVCVHCRELTNCTAEGSTKFRSKQHGGDRSPRSEWRSMTAAVQNGGDQRSSDRSQSKTRSAISEVPLAEPKLEMGLVSSSE